MARAVVFFGPPAIGKTFSLEREKKKDKYRHSQLVILDKDVLNRYFFEPLLVKSPANSPTDILWRTTSHIAQLLSSEFRPVLEQQADRDIEELVVFLQGATIGGVEEDIITLLSAGYSLEFVLLTVEDPSILYKRITERAKGKDYIGAPPMSEDKLRQLSLDCNYSFGRIVKSLQQNDAGAERFYHILQEKKASISYRVELTRVRSKGLDISGYTGLDLERNLALDIYSENEIEMQDASVILSKAAAAPYILATG